MLKILCHRRKSTATCIYVLLCWPDVQKETVTGWSFTVRSVREIARPPRLPALFLKMDGPTNENKTGA
jgi:hypothetical protein